MPRETRRGLTVEQSNILLQGGLMIIHLQGGCPVRPSSEPIPFKMGLQLPCHVRSQAAAQGAVWKDAPTRVAHRFVMYATLGNCLRCTGAPGAALTGAMVAYMPNGGTYAPPASVAVSRSYTFSVLSFKADAARPHPPTTVPLPTSPCGTRAGGSGWLRED